MSDDEGVLDVVEWKRMLMLSLSESACPYFLWDWVTDCCLRAFEAGNIDDDVRELLLKWERSFSGPEIEVHDAPDQ